MTNLTIEQRARKRTSKRSAMANGAGRGFPTWNDMEAAYRQVEELRDALIEVINIWQFRVEYSSAFREADALISEVLDRTDISE